MRRATVLVIAALTGCGRIDFFVVASSPTIDAPGGTMGDAPLSHLIHQYSLNNSYADDLNGPSLIGHGGTFDAGGYSFGKNQGLDVANAMPYQVYTVDFLCRFDTLSGWNKIIDYKLLATDEGFYTLDLNLQFVIVQSSMFATSTQALSTTTQAQLTISRDASGTVNGFIDRVQVWTFNDTGGVAALSAPGADVSFFIDDNVTSQNEATSGEVRRIRIFDAALAAADIPP
jgi:hypothetical protein